MATIVALIPAGSTKAPRGRVHLCRALHPRAAVSLPGAGRCHAHVRIRRGGTPVRRRGGREPGRLARARCPQRRDERRRRLHVAVHLLARHARVRVRPGRTGTGDARALGALAEEGNGRPHGSSIRGAVAQCVSFPAAVAGSAGCPQRKRAGAGSGSGAAHRRHGRGRDAVRVTVGESLLSHLGGVVVGGVVGKRVGVDAGLAETLQLQALLLGAGRGQLGLSGAASSLLDAVVEGEAEQGAAEPSGAGIDGRLGRRRKIVPLLANTLGRRGRDALLGRGVAPAENTVRSVSRWDGQQTLTQSP